MGAANGVTFKLFQKPISENGERSIKNKWKVRKLAFALLLPEFCTSFYQGDSRSVRYTCEQLYGIFPCNKFVYLKGTNIFVLVFHRILDLTRSRMSIRPLFFCACLKCIPAFPKMAFLFFSCGSACSVKQRNPFRCLAHKFYILKCKSSV
jgi:hypothetical protein